MKISLIVDNCQVEDHDLFLRQVARLLQEWGISVKLIIPEEGYLNLAHVQSTADLYLLASSTPLALSLAGILDALGATLVNPYGAVNALHCRLIGLHTLHAHGLPILETYATTNPTQMQELLALGPLLLQLQDATSLNAALPSERFVSTVRELPTVASVHNPIVAQRSFNLCEQYWLIHCIGGQLQIIDPRQPAWLTFPKSFAAHPRSTSGDRTVASTYCYATGFGNGTSPKVAELTELALRCGQVFDIDLFGLKVVEHQGMLYVVDMVSFPDFQASPEAVQHLAEYLFARVQLSVEKKCNARDKLLSPSSLPVS